MIDAKRGQLPLPLKETKGVVPVGNLYYTLSDLNSKPNLSDLNMVMSEDDEI